jgi:hypothetical protein
LLIFFVLCGDVVRVLLAEKEDDDDLDGEEYRTSGRLPVTVPAEMERTVLGLMKGHEGPIFGENVQWSDNSL